MVVQFVFCVLFYDVIIIGVGYNGLVVASYFVMGGFFVLVLEWWDVIGGGAMIEILLFGFMMFWCLQMVWGLQFRIIDDFNLWDYGLDFVDMVLLRKSFMGVGVQGCVCIYLFFDGMYFGGLDV